MKNIMPLLLVLVLFGGAYFLFVYNQDDSTSLNTKESAFAVKDTMKIGKVEIVKVNKGEETSSLSISRKGTGWVDEEGFNLLQSRVDNFLTTLSEIYVRDPISDKAQTSALTILKKSHTEVTIYDLEDKEMKKYFLGAQNSPQTANIALLAGADNAYLVSKPGFNGYISIQYTTDRETWREKLLFNLKAANIRKIQLEYKDGNSDFELMRTSPEGKWQLAGSGEVNQDKARKYVTPFQGKVYAVENASKDYPKMMDSLKTREPDIRFSYETFGGEARTLRLYVRSDNRNSYFGWMEDNPVFYTVQRAVFDKFIVPREFFLTPA